MSSAGHEPPSVPGFDHVRLLGSGRFAHVHLYQQHFPRRLVAIKVIKERLLTWEAEHAFELEANALASLSSHPGIVAIYDAGRSADGHPYLVMEYCPLPTLAEQVKTQRLTAAQALRIGILLAGAVDTAHAHGIVHRDIKPSNVLMTDYGAPKLADFGIASSAWDRNAVTGFTPAWAPPELMTGERSATAATDVYSIAATVYTLLAGHAPHIRPGGSGNSVEDIIARATDRPVPPLPAEVPPALAAVLDRALSREPEERYQTARALGVALQRAQQELGLAITAVTLVAPWEKPSTSPEETEPVPTWRRGAASHVEPQPAPPPPRRRRRTWLAALAAVLMLGAATAAFATLTSGNDAPSRTSAPDKSPTAGPLDLPIPYENQTCNDQWIVVLASSHDKSTWESHLREATEGLGDAKYLKTSESCEIFLRQFQGLDIYKAYTGPFSSLDRACTKKLIDSRPLAVIRHLNLETPERGLCFCLKSLENLPVLGLKHEGPWQTLDKSLVAEVQVILTRAGLNDPKLRYGNFTKALTDLLRSYQSHKHLTETGAIDTDTWAAMRQDYCGV